MHIDILFTHSYFVLHIYVHIISNYRPHTVDNQRTIQSMTAGYPNFY